MKSRNRVLYYGKKAAAFLASVLLLSVLVFYISRLAPGDPLVSYYGDRVEKMTPEERAWAEEKLGLNDPISVQYIRWAGNALHGDFGYLPLSQKQCDLVCAGRPQPEGN